MEYIFRTLGLIMSVLAMVNIVVAFLQVYMQLLHWLFHNFSDIIIMISFVSLIMIKVTINYRKDEYH